MLSRRMGQKTRGAPLCVYEETATLRAAPWPENKPFLHLTPNYHAKPQAFHHDSLGSSKSPAFLAEKLSALSAVRAGAAPF